MADPVDTKEFLCLLTLRQRAILLLHVKHQFTYDMLGKAFKIGYEGARSHVNKIYKAFADWDGKNKDKRQI